MSQPWMPIYIADYLKDTSHLSACEHGAYLLLIFHYWSNGSIPDDDVRLARIARVTTKEWKVMRSTIAAFFTDDWKHGRIERELQDSRAKYERRANAGRQGGNARAMLLRGDSNATSALQRNGGNAQAYAGDARGYSQPQPQPQPLRGNPVREEGPRDLGDRALRPRMNGQDPGWDDDAPFGEVEHA